MSDQSSQQPKKTTEEVKPISSTPKVNPEDIKRTRGDSYSPKK